MTKTDDAAAVRWLLDVRRRGGGMAAIEAANTAFRLTGCRCGVCLLPLEQSHQQVTADRTRGNWSLVGHTRVHGHCATRADLAATLGQNVADNAVRHGIVAAR